VALLESKVSCATTLQGCAVLAKKKVAGWQRNKPSASLNIKSWKKNEQFSDVDIQ
jgi:hypothetical protein